MCRAYFRVYHSLGLNWLHVFPCAASSDIYPPTYMADRRDRWFVVHPLKGTHKVGYTELPRFRSAACGIRTKDLSIVILTLDRCFGACFVLACQLPSCFLLLCLIGMMKETEIE